jgi:hypothetical protein
MNTSYVGPYSSDGTTGKDGVGIFSPIVAGNHGHSAADDGNINESSNSINRGDSTPAAVEAEKDKVDDGNVTTPERNAAGIAARTSCVRARTDLKPKTKKATPAHTSSLRIPCTSPTRGRARRTGTPARGRGRSPITRSMTSRKTNPGHVILDRCYGKTPQKIEYRANDPPLLRDDDDDDDDDDGVRKQLF